MNQEGIMDKKEMKEIKGELKKGNLSSDYDKQSNIKYIPKDEKQKHLNLDKQNKNKQIFQNNRIMINKNNIKKLKNKNITKNITGVKRLGLNQRQQQKRKGDTMQYQNQEGQSNQQLVSNQEFQNSQQPNDYNQPFCYPYNKGQQNNFQQTNDDNNNKLQTNDDNNNQYEKKNNNKNQEKEYPTNQKSKKDKKIKTHINQNSSKQKHKFNNKGINNDDLVDDYQYKNDQGNLKKKNNKDYGLSQYDIYENDDIKNKNRGKFQNNNQNRKQVFKKYSTEQQIEEGKAENEIFEGIFTASEYTREKSVIKCPIFKQKVHINSFVEPNRAFHGALVAFKIINIKN